MDSISPQVFTNLFNQR